ncbi:hypothetical protein CEXT_427301 [Caerostris extrusa]|uniref:Uncharacterized protein n=1 Tax=Caerostris extrusa TaxID=172846 RepID=A0AAV4VNR2_CAEEX|nr:hypothetical protein CEXT_427301 [Caerostris extrusa]
MLMDLLKQSPSAKVCIEELSSCLSIQKTSHLFVSGGFSLREISPMRTKKRAYRENKCVCCWRQRKSDSSGRDNSSRRGTKRAEGVGVAKMYQLENQKRVTIDENYFRLVLC